MLKAFLIITDSHAPGDPDDPERLDMMAASKLLDRLAADLDVQPQVAMDLYRRCCAMGNFFAVDSNRELAGVDDAKPRPAIWTAAANVPVHQAMVDGVACDTFDPGEFAAAARDSGI
jgi:hypothetical protein